MHQRHLAAGKNADLVRAGFYGGQIGHLPSRVAELEVKYQTPTFQNFRLRLLNIKEMKFGC